jgi:isoquinoline 1-oxidoreductase alpha subunit
MATKFKLNGKEVSVQAEPDTPLLWVIRDEIGLTGTKFGCGMALCGACTVHLDGEPIRSCQTPVSVAAGKQVATIESLSKDNSHPLQKAGSRTTCRSAATVNPGQPDERRCPAAHQ